MDALRRHLTSEFVHDTWNGCSAYKRSWPPRLLADSVHSAVRRCSSGSVLCVGGAALTRRLNWFQNSSSFFSNLNNKAVPYLIAIHCLASGTHVRVGLRSGGVSGPLNAKFDYEKSRSGKQRGLDTRSHTMEGL